MSIQHWVGLNQSVASKIKDRDFLEESTGLPVNVIDYNQILKYKSSMLKDYCKEVYLEQLEEGNLIVSGFSTGGSIAIALSSVEIPENIKNPEMYILKAPTIWPKPIVKKSSIAQKNSSESKLSINEQFVAIYYAMAAMANAKNINVPTLILQGNADRKIYSQGSKWLYKHLPKNSQNILVNLNGGHNLHANLEDVTYAMEHIKRFVKTNK